jgi:integrase
MLFKRARSPFWYVRYRDAGGHRVKRSTGTTDRKEAEELEAKWKLEARQQRLWGTQPAYTYDELMLRYMQETESAKRERDAWSAKQLQRFFSGRVLSKLKRADVREYIAMRKSEGVMGSTINREIGLLSASINRARHEWDWDIPNPAIRMRESEGDGRQFYLTRVQFNALVGTAQKQKRAPYLADLITVAVMTGCRRGELLKLEWSRVDLKANVLRLGSEDTKARKARLVPLNASAREALLRRFRYRATHCPDCRWVFSTKGGEGVESVKSSFTAACKAAGLSGFHFHDLRHTCGSWLMQAGVPAGHIAAVLGHSTVRMTERYAHVAPANAEAAVQMLDGVPKPVPTASTAGESAAVSA